MSLATLKGKVGLVTGGGQGIGKGIVKRLLEEGMSLVIAEIAQGEFDKMTIFVSRQSDSVNI